uniref:NB-ARC domain-containing protein n=1 Tax=Leersia perrieri TaxID=77586 RepID=A0A0D9X155_9ORYZ
MPPRRFPIFPLHLRLLSTTSADASTPSPSPSPSPAPPRPTDKALLLRLCTILYQQQHAPDATLRRRLAALNLPFSDPSDLRELFLQAAARFPLSWRPVHRLLDHLTAAHGFSHSPATAARLVDVLAKSRNIDLLHFTLLSLPTELARSPSTLRAAVRGLAAAREVGKVSALVAIFPEAERLRILGFVTDVVCSVCRLPDVAEKVIKQAEHRHGVSRDARCCEMLVVAYCRAGMFSDACRVWNGMERRGIEPGAAAYEEIVVTLFKNNRVPDAMKVFDGMRRRGVSGGNRGGCYRAVVSWLCKEGRMWGAYMVFAEMVKRGVEVDGEVMGDLVYGLLARRKRAGEATEVFREMVARGCEPNMHTYIMLLQGHLGKRGRKGRDPLVNFESIFVGGLVKAGRTLQATKFVERTMWGGVDVPRFDYNKFLYYFSNEEGVLMFEEVGRRLKDVGHVDLGDIFLTYGERMATRDRRRRAMNEHLTEMEHAVVSAAEGAFHTLLGKLGTVLIEEGQLLGGVRRELQFLKDELESMTAFLQDLAERDEHRNQVKVWKKQVREIAYDVEDCIDVFKHQLGDSSGEDGSGPKAFFLKTIHMLQTTRVRHQIARQIQELKRRTMNISDRNSRYSGSHLTSGTAGSSIVVYDAQANLLNIDSRITTLFPERRQLVGIEPRQENLVQWLLDKHVQQLQVISIFGFGGLGKTTLAMTTYESLSAKNGPFQYQAFVTVSQSFDVKVLMRDIFLQITQPIYQRSHHASTGASEASMEDLLKSMEAWSVGQLASILRQQLENKRYLIVLDDIWSVTAWEAKILGKCGGTPLAIVSIAGLLASKPVHSKDLWQKIYSSLGSELESSPSLERLKKILELSYNDLPYHLKTCFLYLSIYPEDHNIRRKSVLRRWVAERFVTEKRGLSVFEVAESYFDEFINRSIIQPVTTSCTGKVKTFRVHDVMLEIIVSKSIEQNFITPIGEQHTLVPQEKIRRLTVHSGGVKDIATRKMLYHVRSLSIYANGEILRFGLMKLLRILDLEDYKFLRNRDLKGFCRLFQLEYLNLRRTHITELPAKNTYYRTPCTNRESADVGDSGYKGDRHKVRFYNHNGLCPISEFWGFYVPNKLGNLDSLTTLAQVEITASTSHHIIELGKLSRLRKLGVLIFVDDDTTWVSLISALEYLSGSLCSLLLWRPSGAMNFDILDSLSRPPIFMKSINFRGQLKQLVLTLHATELSAKNDLKVLGRLPNLLYLRLHHSAYIGAEFAASELEFPSLRLLVIHLTMFEAWKAKFGKGSLPKLAKLELSLFEVASVQDISGIEFLLNLKEVSIHACQCNIMKVEQTAPSLRADAEKNINKPIITIEAKQYTEHSVVSATKGAIYTLLSLSWKLSFWEVSGFKGELQYFKDEMQSMIAFIQDLAERDEHSKLRFGRSKCIFLRVQ